MRRLCVMSVCMVTGLVILVLSSLTYGHLLGSAPEQGDVEFSQCDGNLCYMGIVPGVTTWADAQQIAKQYWNSLPASDRNPNLCGSGLAQDIELSACVPDANMIRVRPSANETQVDAVDFSATMGYWRINLWDVILRKGPPCSVTVGRYSHSLTIAYPDLEIVPDTSRYGQDIPVLTPVIISHHISMVAPAVGQSGPCFPDRSEYLRTAWQGFTSFERYFEHPRVLDN